MKRGRTEEIQFGQPPPRVGGTAPHQRLITTIQPHNAGPTIQYQIASSAASPASVVGGKATTTTPADVAANLSQQQVQSSQQQVPQQPPPPSQPSSVQYTTTSYTTGIAGTNLVKTTGHAQPSAPQPAQQIHVVNTTSQQQQQVRGGKVTPGGGVTGVPTGSVGGGASVVGGGGGGGQVITTLATNVIPNAQPQPPPPPPQGQAQFQRLKVEDALSYLDQVKFRFGNQPQVYNDFLDIMKEFKSQSIDTPGVIQRVSNLFKGHPELIVGFNTFLPPGYKIEVQANDQGYAFQVSVSVPSTSAGTAVAPQPSPHKYSTIFQGGGQIVQTGNTAVNLINYGHSTGSVHTTTIQPVGPSGPGSNSNATSISTIPQSPQNFSRDRERTISGGSGGPTLPANSSGAPVNAVAPDSSVIASQQQQNLHRMISQQVIPHPPPQQQQQQQQQQPQQQPPPPEPQVGGGATPNQPVEFNHAITYVNKIKNRFHSQPEKYKRFLEILHTYQKEQKIYKEGPQGGCNAGAKQLTEAEVYTQVAKLFDNQEDLLREFGQFLPDATSHAPSSLHAGANKNHTLHEQAQPPVPPQPHSKKMSGSVMNASGVKSFNSSHAANLSRLQERDYGQSEKDFASGGPGGGRGSNVGIEKEPRNHVSNQKYAHNAAAMQGSGLGSGNATKRSPSYQSVAPMGGHGIPPREREGPPTKRYKPTCRDITIAEASKFGTLNDYAFFDKVRKALRSPDVYENFLRCLTLFNQEIVSKSELQTLVTPFLSRFPDLLKWFQDFLGPPTATTECVPLASAQRQDRTQSEIATDIDLSTCKRLGASYCALPKSHENVKCSGRTSLCKDVLNDTWVSFPTWAEDSTFVTSRKTQYEEFIYRCEDERFELDVVIETNSATIRVLEGVQKKLSRMSPDEVSRFRLDECLGGTSPTIHQRALRRIYGDKAADIIQGLKKNPVVAVPVVLRRLKAKEEEWREAQKGFNKQWREQNEKYYLKSLDHQGINFKQNDIKSLRSKSLFNEIETLLDEVSYMKRHEQHEDGVTNPLISGPHLVLPYKDKTILDDAANLLIHHVKRQTGIQKQEKARIKHILRQFVPDLFFAPRQQLSDDEREEAEDKDMDVDADHEEENRSSKNGNKNNGSNGSSSTSSSSAASSTAQDGKEATASSSTAIKEETEGAAKTTSTTEGTPAADASSKRSSTEESGKEGASDAAAAAIKTEIKQENDPDQPTSSTSATTTTAAGSSQAQPQQQPNPALPAHAISKHFEEAYTLFFTNNNWYLFLRLHAILCERLRTIYERAQIIATEEKAYQSTRTNSTATALRLKPKSEIKVEDFYATFLDMLKNVLDGNMEAGNYEDSLREMFGIHAYIAFTLDRVVQNAVRQLQHCVTERGALECVELFQLEQRKGGAGGLCRTANRRVNNELAYQRKAEAALQDENCFKVYIYKIDCRVTIELLETDTEDTAQNFANAQQFSNYVDRLSNPAATGTGSESGASTAGGGAGTVTGSATTAGPNSANATNVEIKTEKPDEETTFTGGPRKALFLQRNMRRCKTGCPSPPPEKTAASTSASSSTTTATSSTTTTAASTTTKAAVKKESTVVTPAEKAKPSQTKANAEASSAAATTVVNNNNISSSSKKEVDGGVTPAPPAVWNNTGKVKTPPERLPSSNGDQNYFVDDREQFRLNVNNYKICYVLNKDHIFYKRKSLLRAKETHPKVTQAMHRRFEGVVQRWLDRHVTEAQRVECREWLMGTNSDLPKTLATVVKRNNDVARTPYMTYSRYRVEKVATADHHLS